MSPRLFVYLFAFGVANNSKPEPKAAAAAEPVCKRHQSCKSNNSSHNRHKHYCHQHHHRTRIQPQPQPPMLTNSNQSLPVSSDQLEQSRADAKETAEDSAILKRFKIVQLIGIGNYARVYKGYSQSGRELAIKSINLSRTTDNYRYKFLPRELTILKKISHQNICKVHEILQVSDRVFIVMQFCSRGTIADLLHRCGPLSELVTRYLFVPTADAVNYLHSMDFAHRDIKVENILLDHEFNPKLTDFSYSISVGANNSCNNRTSGSPPPPPPPGGFLQVAQGAPQPAGGHKTNVQATRSPGGMGPSARDGQAANPNGAAAAAAAAAGRHHHCGANRAACAVLLPRAAQTPPPSPAAAAGQVAAGAAAAAPVQTRLNETFCGTLPYLSPEMARQHPYDPKKTDVWSLGVCLYIMLNDKAPFPFDDLKLMIRKQMSRDYKFRANVEFSSEVKELIALMLEPDYTRRLHASDLIQHPWTFGQKERPPLIPAAQSS